MLTQPQPAKACRKIFDHRAVLTMLAAGIPKRQIESETGVSARTIGRIEEGARRVDHSRCPGCGGLQTMPCLVCATSA